MKLRVVLIVALISFLIAGSVAITTTNGQFGANKKDAGQGLELINDLQPRKAAADDNGRFRITALPEHTLLLDSRTGDTWVLTNGEKLYWLEVPRRRLDEKQEDSKAGNKEVFDPFK